GVEEVKRRGTWNKGQRSIFVSAFGTEMNSQCRFIELPCEASVKIGVVGRGNIGFWFCPKGGPIGHLQGFGTRLLDDLDGHRHVTRLLFNDPLDSNSAGIGCGVLREMQHDAGPSMWRLLACRGRQGKRTLSIRRPLPSFASANTAGEDVNALCDHKCRIKTYAKLPNERGTISGLSGLNFIQKSFRT